MKNVKVDEKKTILAQAKARHGEIQPVHHSDPAGVQTQVVIKRKNVDGFIVKVVHVSNQTIAGASKSSPTNKYQGLQECYL